MPIAPCHVLPWSSKCTRKLVKSVFGGEVFASSGMMGHVASFREFCFHKATLRRNEGGWRGRGKEGRANP